MKHSIHTLDSNRRFQNNLEHLKIIHLFLLETRHSELSKKLLCSYGLELTNSGRRSHLAVRCKLCPPSPRVYLMWSGGLRSLFPEEILVGGVLGSQNHPPKLQLLLLATWQFVTGNQMKLGTHHHQAQQTRHGLRRE